jgi:uncharacterized protein YdhG (YjbR/CyaY superfamily)
MQDSSPDRFGRKEVPLLTGFTALLPRCGVWFNLQNGLAGIPCEIIFRPLVQRRYAAETVAGRPNHWRGSMAKTDFKSVDEYIASQPEAVQVILERVRNSIRKAVPGAEEVISYQIPAYKLRGGAVVYFAGWKQHYSLYPATDQLVEAFKDDLAPYEVNKGTIRFPLSRPAPMKLIERIAKFRAKEVAEHERARAATAKKR